MSISLGGTTNFCVASKRCCDVGEIPAPRLCRPIQLSNASSPSAWNSKTAKPGKNGASAPAQTFTASMTSIFEAEAADGGASSPRGVGSTEPEAGEPGVAEFRPPVQFDHSYRQCKPSNCAIARKTS